MRKIFTLVLGVLLVSTLFAQKREAVIMKASVAPVLDGVIDDVWAEANTYNIDLNFQSEIPTLPTENPQTETTWKGLWTEEGIYILLTVMDDTYYPNYLGPSGSNDYMYDKTEIYFDVNYILEDGLGCQSGANGNKGHYQFAPSFTATNIDGHLVEVDGYKYALLVTDPNYVQEYFIPMDKFVTNEGGPIDLTGQVGFDVTIIDRDSEADASRKRSVWNNIGTINEAWANMDECGIITFDGAEPPVYVDKIELAVDGAITGDNQPLQVGLTVLPEDATVKTVKWVIKTADGGRARAQISNTGVITPVIDEEIVVQAISSDGFVYSNEISISISGQSVTMNEINYIKNGNFDVADSLGAAGAPWSGGAVVVDGVASMNNAEVDADPWGWTFGQEVHVPFEIRAENFVYKFKMWADAPREVVVDFEDTKNGYPRYGVSTDASATRSGGGVTDWLFGITTEPTWYTLNCTFENMLEDATQKMNYMLGWDTPVVYVDSVYLLAVSDMALLSTAISQERAMESFKVYPNPASSKLHVEFSTPNTTVAIYNSVGVKMDEEVVFGNHHMFDISRYSKGLYFVKANGAVVKFIK
jgi:hypothetical protein